MRSAVLVAAAALFAASVGAAAADGLPRTKRSEPQKRDDAKACQSYGAGFVRLPGSSTCVKVGGAMRVETQTTFGR